MFKSGATSFTAGTGYWLDFNGGTPRLRVGNPAGNRIAWDGTDLTLVAGGGNVTVDSTGITLAPTTSAGFQSGQSYKWTMVGGNMGLTGRDNGSVHTLYQLNEWRGTGNGTVTTAIEALNFPSSGGTTNGADIELFANGTDSWVEISAPYLWRPGPLHCRDVVIDVHTGIRPGLVRLRDVHVHGAQHWRQHRERLSGAPGDRLHVRLFAGQCGELGLPDDESDRDEHGPDS